MTSSLNTIAAIIVFLGGWLGAWSLMAMPLRQKFGWRPFQPTPPEQKLLLILPLYALAPIAIAISNRIRHQTWVDQGIVGSRASVLEFGLGWAIAIAGLSLVLLMKRFFGLITLPADTELASESHVLAGNWLPSLGLVALGIGIGGIEELVFRGWLQTQLELTLSPWGAAIIASAMFALAHLIWDGRGGLWQQPGLWLLGMVLVAARWIGGGEIAIAWGLHAGWVTGLAYIGKFVRPSPVAATPTWLTGRKAQPLTDVGDCALLVLTVGVVWYLAGLLPTV